MAEFVDYIKKLMGWCPQKGFNLADARREKHELYDDNFYQNYSHDAKGVTFEEKLNIDYQNVSNDSIAIILFSIVIAIIIATFFLIITVLLVPIPRYFVYTFFSIGFFIVSFLLLYFNRINAELNTGSIIVNRPFHKSVIIPKDSILKSEVVKNFNHSLRWIFTLLVIFWLALSMKSILDVSSDYFTGNYSLLDTISRVIMHIGSMLAYTSIYFISKKKSPYRSALKITAKLKNEVTLYVYVDDPQEIKNALEVNL